MRGLSKIAIGGVAVALAATTAACSSNSSSSGAKDTKPVGAFKTLTGNTTTVNLDPTFVAALGKLNVKPGVIGTAKADLTSSPATLTFPITGGNATIYKKGAVTPYVQGTINHQGSGFSLTAGGTTVQLENFVVDPGNNSKLTGEVIAGGKTLQGVKLFDLDGSTLQTPTISSDSVATLNGTTIYLSQEAATALNGAFKLTGTSNALKGGVGTGVKIGTATIKATGK